MATLAVAWRLVGYQVLRDTSHFAQVWNNSILNSEYSRIASHPMRYTVFLCLVVLVSITVYARIGKTWILYCCMGALLCVPYIQHRLPLPYYATLNDHCDSGYDLIRYMEQEHADVWGGDTLYMIGDDKTKLSYQYTCMRYHIIEDIPTDDDAIVFSNVSGETVDGFSWVELDDNEGVYVKGAYATIVDSFIRNYVF